MMSTDVVRLLGGALAAVFLAAAAPAGTFTSEDVSITIGSNGKVTSILDRVTGMDRIKSNIPQHQQYFCVVTVEGETVEPTLFMEAGDLLTFTFASLTPAAVISVRVRSLERYLVFELVGAAGVSEVDEIRFVNLWTRDSIDRTGERFMRYEDAGVGRYLGLYGLDPYTLVYVGPDTAGGYLWGLALPDLPAAPPLSWPRAVALAACDANVAAMSEIAALVEAGEGIPLGMAARQHPSLRRSCIMLAEMSVGQQNIVLQCAQAAGVGRILLFRNTWADARRAYAPSQLWKDFEELRGWIDECRAAGILVGAHALPTVIPANAYQHIYTGCDARIRRDRTLTLATTVAPAQTNGLINTLLPPVGWPTQDGQRDIVINQEIIQYTSLKTTPPYGFLGPFIRAKNQTGPGGLGPQYHVSGSVIGRLVSADEAGYQWSLADGGVKLQCDEVAAAVAQAGFDYVYADALEEVPEPHWYTAGRAVAVLLESLAAAQAAPLYLESSAHRIGWLWPLVAVHGQIDYYLFQSTFKQEVDRNLEHLLIDATDGALRQFGWAPLNHPFLPHATPDDLEYLLAKSVAYDAPVVVVLFVWSLPNWTHRDANWRLMKTYEELRLSGAFPYAARVAARQPGKDFMHFADDAGNNYLTPVSLLNIANNSPLARGFISDDALRGDWFASLWPADDQVLTMRLPGVAPENLIVREYDGALIEPLVDGSDLLVPLGTRIYVQMVNVADPWSMFQNAALTQGKP